MTRCFPPLPFVRKASLLLAAVVWLAPAPAKAGLLPVSVTSTPDGGNVRWTYGIVLTTDAHLNPGDYFTIMDFAGFVPGSVVMPAGWNVNVAGTGSVPAKVLPTDDPGVPDLTFTYAGPDGLTGQIGLGNFSAISTFQDSGSSSFVGTTHRNVDGHVDSNITDTQVPVGVPPPPLEAPEPATLLMVGLGLPLAAGARLLRRKK